jgi:hypothetical protein
MSANLEDFLPAIFRKRRATQPTIPIDQPVNMLAPQEGAAGILDDAERRDSGQNRGVALNVATSQESAAVGPTMAEQAIARAVPLTMADEAMLRAVPEKSDLAPQPATSTRPRRVETGRLSEGSASQVGNSLPAIFRRRVTETPSLTGQAGPDKSLRSSTTGTEGKTVAWYQRLVDQGFSPGQQGDSMPGQQADAIRPRRVHSGIATEASGLPDAAGSETQRDPHGAFGSSGEPFGSSRPRRTQPRDYVADDEQYLRDLENEEIRKNPWKSMAQAALRGFAQGGPGGALGGAVVGLARPKQYGQERQNIKIERAQKQLARDMAVGQQQAQTRNADAAAYEKRNRAPSESTRIIAEGEYPDIPAGTEIRQTWNGREYVDAIGGNGRPVVSKAPPADKAAAREIRYNNRREAVLVPKDGGPAMPIFNPDGTPLTKEANESGTVQTAFRLQPDGITQIQIERDPQSGEWVDSIGPGKRPIVRGQVGKIDPATGAPMAAIVTAGRITEQQRQEGRLKRQAYTKEEQDWVAKESNFRQNKTNEDEAIKTKTGQLQSLYSEQPRAYGGLAGGTRSQQEIDTDKARLQKEIEAHRQRATHFQTEADKAASAATEARRNAGVYSESTGSQGVIGRAPANDGKHHYTTAEIRSQADAAGKSYESLYNKLKADKRVVIDQ